MLNQESGLDFRNHSGSTLSLPQIKSDWIATCEESKVQTASEGSELIAVSGRELFKLDHVCSAPPIPHTRHSRT